MKLRADTISITSGNVAEEQSWAVCVSYHGAVLQLMCVPDPQCLSVVMLMQVQCSCLRWSELAHCDLLSFPLHVEDVQVLCKYHS